MIERITNLKKFINPYLYSNKSNVIRLSTGFILDILTRACPHFNLSQMKVQAIKTMALKL